MSGVPRFAARLRGGCVGALSGAAAVAGHGFAGGMIPTQSSVVLLVLACAGIGVVAAGRAAARLPMLVSHLALGQLVGHIALSLSGHGHDLLPSPAMIASHAVVALAGAVLVCAGERVCTALLTPLRRLAPIACVLSADETPTRPQTRYVPAVRLRLPVVSGIGTRGPPA